MSSKRLNGKKGKGELSNKNKNTFQIVYIFHILPTQLEYLKQGILGSFFLVYSLNTHTVKNKQ